MEQIQTTHAVFFMNSKEIKEVVLLLNTSQASKNIDNLKNKLEETRRLKEEAFNKGDNKAFKKLGQEEKNRTPVKPDYIEIFYLPPTVDSQSKPTCTTTPPRPIRNRTALHHCTLRSIRNRNLLADLHPTSDSKSNGMAHGDDPGQKSQKGWKEYFGDYGETRLASAFHKNTYKLSFIQ